MRRGSGWAVIPWMLAVLLAAVPLARADEPPGPTASGGGGGHETMAYFQIGNALACEYSLSAFGVPPFVVVVGYLRCTLWPDVADP